MSSQVDSADPIVLECDLDEPPEKVWRALTETELLEAWLLTEPACSQPSTPGVEWEIVGREPYRRLSVRWCEREDAHSEDAHSEDARSEDRPRIFESIVRFELSPSESGGTHLRIVHGDFRVVQEPRRVTSGSGSAEYCMAHGPWRLAA